MFHQTVNLSFTLRLVIDFDNDGRPIVFLKHAATELIEGLKEGVDNLTRLVLPVFSNNIQCTFHSKTRSLRTRGLHDSIRQ